MKNLKKHPKQQRMEDMTFPLQKEVELGKAVSKMWRMNLYGGRAALDEGTMPANKPIKKYIDVCVGDLKKDEEYEAYWDGNNWILKDKVTWEGREWLRSINDPNHERHVAVVILLVASIIYAACVLYIVQGV